MAVEPGFIGVVDGAHVQKNFPGDTALQGRRNHHMEAVPAVIVGVSDALLVPVLVQGQHLPGAVIKIGLLPGGIVSFAEAGTLDSNALGAGHLRETEGQHQHKGGK